ncbi:CLUMA_CG020608, isoform A [Clunio marinus]|uniref:CLUMA_CG020608, isoform A n=1 Tax=Clunio marinus TaxID=568069 RepID=A0A1J1J788_9DIPT|nr:CLUMA_CG020608, isoform A [Clunio marinus]
MLNILPNGAMLKIIFFVTLIFAVEIHCDGETVPCATIEDKECHSDFCKDASSTTFKTCSITQRICQKGTTLSESQNDTVTAVDFQVGGLFRYLPNNISEAFPNLIAYKASYCKIRDIHKLNFHGLAKLLSLNLDDNFILKIESDVFDSLTSLVHLSLANNKIKLIDSGAFNGLTKLNSLSLQQNICVNKSFNGKDEMATLNSTIRCDEEALSEFSISFLQTLNAHKRDECDV